MTGSKALDDIVNSLSGKGQSDLRAFVEQGSSPLEVFVALRVLYEEHGETEFVHEWILCPDNPPEIKTMLSWFIRDPSILKDIVETTGDGKMTGHLMHLYDNPILKYYELQGKSYCQEFTYVVDNVDRQDVLFQALVEGHMSDTGYDPCAVYIIQQISETELLLSLKLLLPSQYQALLSMKVNEGTH